MQLQILVCSTICLRSVLLLCLQTVFSQQCCGLNTLKLELERSRNRTFTSTDPCYCVAADVVADIHRVAQT